MKYLRVLIAPLKLKGDSEDREQLQQDLYELVQTLIENEALDWDIDDEESEEDED
jgi:hypothetical protein